MGADPGRSATDAGEPGIALRKAARGGDPARRTSGQALALGHTCDGAAAAHRELYRSLG